MDTLGMTSRWVAAARERESARADRLFEDPFAGALAGEEGRAMLARLDGSGPDAENPFLAIRTRFLDEVLLEACRGGLSQVVILAAGMDARAFRLGWPPETRIFVVERADVLDYKESILAGLDATPRAERITVAVDLRDDFVSALSCAGFSKSQPAAFLIEGLLPYLPDEQAASTLLDKVAGIAAVGSFVALDMVGTSFLESQWTRPHIDKLAAEGAPWQFGTDDPEGFLERAGFRDVCVTQPGEANSARWPHPVVSRGVPGVPRSYFVTARR